MWVGLCANAPGLSTPAILRGMESVCLRGGDLDAALRAAWVDERVPVAPFGGGHVGQAVKRAVADLPPGSRVLVMGFSHAEDLAVVDACLQRLRQQGDLPFIGLIGSRTK